MPSVEVVLDGSFESLFKRVFWLPAERLDRLSLESVALVVASTVVDELDQVFVCADCIQNRFGDLEVRLLGVTPDVVALADIALFENQVEGTTVVFNVDPLTNV